MCGRLNFVICNHGSSVRSIKKYLVTLKFENLRIKNHFDLANK